MIVERKDDCDCPYGNFTCEAMGCVRSVRSREQLQADSDAEKEKRASNPFKDSTHEPS